MKAPSISQYKQRLAAFIDILGWRQLIADLERNRSHFERVLAALKNSEEHAVNLLRRSQAPSGNLDQDLYDGEVSLFSDSIVVSCSDRPEHYLPFLSGIAIMCFELLGAANLLCRGGITTGKLYHDKRWVFGQGLISAYELESKLAKYPRIVIDQRVISTLRTQVDVIRCPIGTPKVEHYYRIDDGDAVMFLDYLKLLFEFSIDDGQPALSLNDKINGAKAIRRRLVTMYEEAPSDESITEKYHWFFNYFNLTISDLNLPVGLRLVVPKIA